jgi:hypothetical protein
MRFWHRKHLRRHLVRRSEIKLGSDRAAIYTLAGSIIAATIALIGSNWATKSSFDEKMVDIGVNILAADPSKSDVAPARKWAIDLVEKHSGLPFDSADRESLLHHPIQVASANGGLPSRSSECARWRRNSDGSWSEILTFGLAGLGHDVSIQARKITDATATRAIDQVCPH